MEDDKGGAIIKKTALFPKEMEMYAKYLPAFEEFYKTAGLDIQLAPKCLQTEKEDGCINFVFEDLTMRNFENLDRLNGCDMTHMKRILSKLAEFHAASAVYEEQNGAYPEDFQYGFVDSRQGPGFLESIYHAKRKNYLDAMAQWGITDADDYIKKFVS